jgi:hypothetical protein
VLFSLLASIGDTADIKNTAKDAKLILAIWLMFIFVFMAGLFFDLLIS